MPYGESKCEVLVIGGGPAGSITSTLLAREGLDVVQVVPAFGRIPRPNEILCPNTRRLLRHHGLAEPEEKGDCRGVLSCWEQVDASFYDYELLGCMPALVVQRASFHLRLVSSAKEAGVRILVGARVCGDQAIWTSDTPVTVKTKSDFVKVSPNWVIDASGRQGKLRLPAQVWRAHLDRLIAFTLPFAGMEFTDCLVLEAVENGWWYIAPQVNGEAHLVFLTDGDISPRGREARKKWLLNSYNRTVLVSGLASDAPNFDAVRGTDARFSKLNVTAFERWAAVGDRAIALDPLSGTGIAYAIAAAEWWRNAIAVGMENNQGCYVEWCNQKFEVERKVRKEMYSLALKRFSGSKFWSRRV